MPTATGLDVLAADSFRGLKGRQIGIVCNQAAITKSYDHIVDAILPYHHSGDLTIRAVFGPQHGIWGHTQDNMIEWEGYDDSRTGLKFYSLYGEHREPPREWLEGIDVLVVDLADIGSRYYTFLWTLALCMKACEPLGIEIYVLDRPNPIGGVKVEGTVGLPEFASFVGLFPLPMRHGMTLGEVAHYLKQCQFPNSNLTVESVQGWERILDFSQAQLPFVMPSPNMPGVDTALVYPGGCLIEGTNLSEGRGTTRPFEIVGAPYLDAWQFAQELNQCGLRGAAFRPICFQPTFQKHAGQICGGVFVHVTDKDDFEPVLTYLAILQGAQRLSGGEFTWNNPPYEYEHKLLPFDILAGNGWLRGEIERQTSLSILRDHMKSEVDSFAQIRENALIY